MSDERLHDKSHYADSKEQSSVTCHFGSFHALFLVRLAFTTTFHSSAKKKNAEMVKRTEYLVYIKHIQYSLLHKIKMYTISLSSELFKM